MRSTRTLLGTHSLSTNRIRPRFRLIALLCLLICLVQPFMVGASPYTAANASAEIMPVVHGADYTLPGNSFKSSNGSNGYTVERVGNPPAGSKDTTLGNNLVLPPGSKQETFTAGVTQSTVPFTDLAPHWYAEVPEGTDVLVEVRTSRDGAIWTDWQAVDEEDIIMPQDSITETYGSTISVPQSERTHNFVQGRVTLATQVAGRTPVFHQLTYTYIDAGVTPNPPRPQASIQSTPSDVPKPPVVTRNQWGAPDGESSPDWTPKYRRVTHIIIHHTATSNNDTDWAARVRAIWYYHANTRGWGDIGYNYLVDPNGVIYEGRAGGDDVEAGHAYPFNTGSMGVGMIGDFMTVAPTKSALAALTDLISWKVSQRGIDPLGVAPLTGYTNCGGEITYTRPTIAGHRDYAGTACGKGFNTSTCPGDVLHALLPQIRDSIVADQPPLRAVFVRHNTPGNLAPGSTSNVTLSVRNSGSLAWPAVGAKAVSLGYKWYTADLTPVSSKYQAIFTPLPRDVQFADTITLTARLNAPSANGKYVLMWDMYQLGASWFAEQGASQRLRVDVVLGKSTGDTVPPASEVLPLPIYSNDPDILVRWAGDDGTNGSGIASYDIQYRLAPNGQWTDWLLATSQTQSTYKGDDGNTYEFRARAHDAAGNVEAWPGQADAYTTVDTRPPVLLINSPQEGAHVKPGPLLVTGQTEPGAFIAVNNTRAQEVGGVFTATVQAEGRDFVIDVTAADAAANVSRAEVTVQAAARYNDVPVNDPDSIAVESLSDLGLLTGYADGSFHPDASVTRAQYAKLLCTAMRWGLIKPPDSRFSDVPTDSPLFTYVETAAARGYLRGYTDGSFQPNAPISRDDATRIWVMASGWQLTNVRVSAFLDLPPGFSDTPFIETARSHGLITPDENSNFRPNEAIKRREIAEILYKYLLLTNPPKLTLNDGPE